MKSSLLNLSLAVLGVSLLTSVPAHAEGLPAGAQAKVDALLKQVQAIAADPAVVSAVKAQNGSLPADRAAMTQDKWKTLTVLDPLVRGFSKNAAADVLKAKKPEAATEAFVSDAAGNKVAFLSKTSGWCHKGKAKHDDPVSGKTWQGPIETDESTGLQQVQIAVPVLDGATPIGSLVVGLSVNKLGQ